MACLRAMTHGPSQNNRSFLRTGGLNESEGHWTSVSARKCNKGPLTTAVCPDVIFKNKKATRACPNVHLVSTPWSKPSDFQSDPLQRERIMQYDTGKHCVCYHRYHIV